MHTYSPKASFCKDQYCFVAIFFGVDAARQVRVSCEQLWPALWVRLASLWWDRCLLCHHPHAAWEGNKIPDARTILGEKWETCFAFISLASRFTYFRNTENQLFIDSDYHVERLPESTSWGHRKQVGLRREMSLGPDLVSGSISLID